MLEITVPGGEYWDETKEEFLFTKPVTLQLEHSLISISKWEAKWHEPFFEKDAVKTGNTTNKTDAQVLDYIRCMTINKIHDPDVYRRLSGENVRMINDYISNPMTASVINSPDDKLKRSTEFVTSELIYYWMIAFNIPVEFEQWHINRLIMLIRICSEKNKPQKKLTPRQIAERNRARNEARKAKLHAKG